MKKGLVALVLGVTTHVSVFSQTADLLGYQNHNITFIDSQEQAQLKARSKYFEDLISSYFKSNGVDKPGESTGQNELESKIMLKLAEGDSFTLGSHKFRLKINLNDSTKTLEVIADDFYFDDNGVNGVDVFGIVEYPNGTDVNYIQKRPLRFTKLLQSDRLILHAAGEVQIAALKVMSAYYSSGDLNGAVNEFKKKKQVLYILLGSYTS